MRTFTPKKDEIKKKWWLINAEGRTLGRMATEIAVLLRGKRKPEFAQFIDCGDFVIVINAEKIEVTGNRLDQKVYYRHSGYPGGLKHITLRNQLDKFPDRVIRSAVWGMVPHNRYGRKLMKKLKIYGGSEHPHQAQMPTVLTFE